MRTLGRFVANEFHFENAMITMSHHQDIRFQI